LYTINIKFVKHNGVRELGAEGDFLGLRGTK